MSVFAGGIIAAGEGSRLRQGGFAMPKPMVPVAGVPLIESTIRNLRAARVGPLAIIVNEQERECADWIRACFPDLDLEFANGLAYRRLGAIEFVSGPGKAALAGHGQKDFQLGNIHLACLVIELKQPLVVLIILEQLTTAEKL